MQLYCIDIVFQQSVQIHVLILYRGLDKAIRSANDPYYTGMIVKSGT